MILSVWNFKNIVNSVRNTQHIKKRNSKGCDVVPKNTEKTTTTSPTEYLGEVKSELKKVHWPSKQELSEHTLTVIVMVLITAIFIYCIDAGVGAVIEKLIGR
jgi:preprotein translocase, secE subunit